MLLTRLIAVFSLAIAFSVPAFAVPDTPSAPAPTASTAQVATPAPTTADTVPTEFNIKNPYEWVQLGKNAGLAMAEIAGQLGVAGDQVLDSNSGKIAVALVGAKLLGVTANDIGEIPYRILSFFLGIVFLFVGVRIWSKFLNIAMATQEGKQSDDEQKRVRLERTVVGCAIIPVVVFGTGLILFSTASLVVAGLMAIVLAVVKFVIVIDPS